MWQFCKTELVAGCVTNRKNEVVAPPLAVAAASLGDFAVAAAAVNLEDVAGWAVGACVGVLVGWSWGQLGRGKAVFV